MQRSYRYKPRMNLRARTLSHNAAHIRGAAFQIPLAVKGLALLFIISLVIRGFSALGADTASNAYFTGLVANENALDSILNSELGSVGQTQQDVSIASMILDPSILAGKDQTVSSGGAASAAPSAAAEGGNESSKADTDTGLYYENWDSANSNTGSKPNIITKPASTTSADYVAVDNKTEYSIDTAALLKSPLKIAFSGSSPVVLIIHTHSSEAYMPDGTDQYYPSDPYRTQDKSHSIIRVGDELATALSQKGIPVIHDRGVYDYPSYQGAYNRSYAAIQAYLKKYPSIKIVIDLHRDAIEAADGSVYKTIAQIGSSTCSQVLLVMGTNSSGLNHPKWKENFKLALHIQSQMNKLYPSLAKPIELSQYRYNQQATTGSMIVEIGCTGNTLQESLTAARYFADAFAKAVLKLNK